MAAIFAVVAIGLWAAQFSGAVRFAYLPGPFWHAHEMLYGYTFAVLTGFLFTAVRNWTQQPTPSGLTLGLIAVCWLAARLAVGFGAPGVASVADTAFALAVAIGIAIPLSRARNLRNYAFVALVFALGASNLAFYAGAAGFVDLPLERMLRFGLDLMLIAMSAIGGRVIPMFTANAVAGSNPQRLPLLERCAMLAVAALLLDDYFRLPAMVSASIAGAAGVLHAARWLLWKPWLTRSQPLLWILHAAYAWIPVYLGLRIAVALDALPFGIAAHALAVGAIGGLTLGMMSRTARGHTGRTLEAGVVETLSFVLIQLAAAVRVLPPLLSWGVYRDAIVASAILWCLAFALFVAVFLPILIRPRSDGRPG